MRAKYRCAPFFKIDRNFSLSSLKIVSSPITFLTHFSVSILTIVCNKHVSIKMTLRKWTRPILRH
jgi:hypothetical protein